MTMLQTLREFTSACKMNRHNQWKAACAGLVLLAATAVAAPAQTFTTLWDFAGFTGLPNTALVQGRDGNFYGTTTWGGGHGAGTVFEITPGGKQKVLYSFCAQASCTDGGAPGGLIQATDGNFYGTTSYGGGGDVAFCDPNRSGYAHICGTVFRLTPSGTLTTLHGFCSQTKCTDGAWPRARLVQGTDGNFYGTTWGGGLAGSCGGNDAPFGCGTVFKITPDGTLTTLYRFCTQTNCADGANLGSALVQATDGNFYGTVYGGGGYGSGTFFRITPAGQLTTLHNFCSPPTCSDGANPEGLIQAADGNFYGSTDAGFFRITSTGKLTALCGCGGEVVQASDGNFYGTATYGGPRGSGTIFEITQAGKMTTLYAFNNGADGGEPHALPVQGTDGNFYGTTWTGGLGYGTVFRLSTGLGPFVSFIPSSGKVGATAQILGQGFTDTTAVSFSGVPASFTVKSDTYLTATVPAGAEWGIVTVTTPTGILKSNKAFRVTPQIFSMSTHSGLVGSTVVMTGMTLAQAYAITFGNVKATNYTVDSDTQVTATVPAGAQSGKIAVLTPGGTAYTPTCFDVTP
jgi:uncharacterized repeat protein (TIGR03803 family)